MTKKAILLFLISMLLVSIAIRPIHAQVTAQVAGTVEDPQHAAVIGANVVVTNEATGFARKTVTNESGGYIVALLQPGTYRINVEAPGFRPLTRAGILLQVAQTATVNLDLQVGTDVQTVSVTDEVQLLDTSTDAIGGVVSPAQVENLPMLGRNSNSLMVLEPGVVATRQTPANPVLESHYQFFSINGSRPDQSQFLLDGGNDTNLAFNGPEYTPGVEEVQESLLSKTAFSVN
jgi:hypothetical protein